METFSNRFNFKPEAVKISVRNDAPADFRSYLITLMSHYMRLKELRDIVCRGAKEAPDPNNWSENDFMKEEVRQTVEKTHWSYVYDIIELFSLAINHEQYCAFERELNDYFITKGIGWQLKNKVLEFRGDESFETIINTADSTLNNSGVNTSANEIKEAIKDLSRRPNPEITGAIQHSVAALECLCRKVTNEPSMTLGKLIKNHPEIVPEPLNDVVYKIFGFSSVKGRHLTEGNNPTFEEAELIVHLSAAICNYLCKAPLTTH